MKQSMSERYCITSTTEIFVALIVFSCYYNIDEYENISGCVDMVDPVSNVMLIDTGGKLEKIYVEEGSKVKKGQVLFKMDSAAIENDAEFTSDNGAIQAYFDSYNVEYVNAKSNRDGYKQSYDNSQTDYDQQSSDDTIEKSVSKQDVDNAKKTYESSAHAVDTLKSNTKKDINSIISSFEQEATSLSDDKKKIESSIKNVANAGDVITAGEQVMQIIPDSEFEIILYIDDTNINKLKAGQNVHYAFDGILYQDYGMVKGKLLSISDTTINTEGIPYYVGKASIEKTVLTNKKTKEVAVVTSGMRVKAKVKIGKKKIIKKVLEMMNIEWW